MSEKDWRNGLTPGQIRDIECQRGASVLMEKHNAAGDMFAALFDPDYKHRLPTEYNRQLAERNKHRWEREGNG